MNPALEALLERLSHGGTLVIADRGFPYWPNVQTIDLSLVDDIPTVLDVLHVVRDHMAVSHLIIASEFATGNSPETRERFAAACMGIPVIEEPHLDFKRRVPQAIGLVRTGDTIQYANVIVEVS